MSSNLPPYPPDDSGQWPPRRQPDLAAVDTLALTIRLRRLLEESYAIGTEVERRARGGDQ